MHVLIVTTEWPVYENDITGIHVINQVNRLKESGVEVSVFNFRGCKNPFNYFKAVLRFWHLDLKKFDLIHAHHGQSGIVALSQNKLPVVVTFHGSDLQGIFDKCGNLTFQGRILKRASHLVARLADEIIIVSEHLKFFLPPRSYHVIPIGIDMDMFFPRQLTEARKMLGLLSDNCLVLFVGDPDRTEKRFWLARESIEIIRNHCNVELIVAQGIPNEKMPLYMNACDVLLITSSSEGSPTVLKEALACNLPVVSTDVGDVRERIDSIDGCVVCKNDRPETIAAALVQVLSRRQRINSRQTVLELEEHLLTQKIIQVYQLVIDKAKMR
jgi:glycosyltransferase involved in cell wall biosynthesis